MDDRINDIHLRLIKFFKDNENQEATFEQLSKEFTYDEIIDLVKTDPLAPVLTKFVYKMDKPQEFYEYLDGILNDPKTPNYEKRDLLFIASEDYLIEVIKKDKTDRSYHRYFRTDEYRLKAMKLQKIKNVDYLYTEYITVLDDENLKVKLLGKIFFASKSSILSSIKDDKLKEKLIPKYLKYADKLICNLADENMRIYY